MIREHIYLADAVSLTYMAISIGLSIIAGLLLKPKSKSPIQDDKPTTLTTRGSFTPWFLGIRQVGPIFAWAGDRERRSERSGGGKGTPAPQVDVWYEAGWHILGVTATALHQITEGGKIIFSGPITSESHPSGSTIELSTNESFTIYWGEPDQPINTFLGDPARVTVSSRWPYACYVVWNKKRLGSSPNWQLINYVLERRPSQSVLTQSDGWYEPTKTLDGPVATVVDFLANADPDVGYIEVAGDFSHAFEPGRPVRISGNALPITDYEVRRAVALPVQVGTSPLNGLPIYATHTQVFIDGGTAGADDNGFVYAYTFATDDGANIAHAMAELLFANYPLGLQLDPNGPEPFDIDSLEALGVEAETDGWRASLVAVDGEEAKAILGAALQDHGTLLPFDESGRLSFRRCRAPVGTLPNISVDLEAQNLPEVESLHGEKRADKMVFKFTDRDHGFSDMTISEDDDGQMSYLEYAKAKEVSMSTTVNFDTAAKLCSLRSQEELAGAGSVSLSANRGSRHLIPGDDFVSESFDEVLRLLEINIDPLSETVTLKCTPDFYGARKSDFVTPPGGGATNLGQPEQDLQFRMIEVPEHLLDSDKMLILVPRIRAHNQITEAAIWLSRDNTSYTSIGSESGDATGGLTDVTMDADGPNFLDQGPTFVLRGPDIATAIDLSADPTNFGLGRQVVAIVSTAGVEIGYVQKLTAMGGGIYRLDGLLRARYDTRKVAHPVGAEVYVFQDSTFSAFSDLLLVPGEDLYTKSQPSTSGGIVPLSGVSPDAETLRGKGLRPIDPEDPYVAAPHLGSPVYQTGDDVIVRWNWSSATATNTGAGFQNAGTPIGGSGPASFVVELLTPSDVVVSTTTVSVAQATFLAAALAAAPISNGNFKVRITQAKGGYSSEPVVLSVTHIA